MMNPVSKPFGVSMIRALILASMSSLAVNSYAQESVRGDLSTDDELFVLSSSSNVQNSGFSPFTIDDTSVRISANDISVNLLANKQFVSWDSNKLESEPLSFSIKDEQQGEWLVSLDLSHSGLSSTANTELSTSYQMPNQSSQFFINYGNQSLPVSVSIENPVDYALNGKAVEQESTLLGFNQQLSEGWDVTISYMKSDVNLVTTESALSQIQAKNEASYRFYYDFNQDGAPETINLMSDLTGIEGFKHNLEGIEIKISRQISDNFALGASVELAKGSYQEQALNFNKQQTPFETSALSLSGGMRLAEDWTVAANVRQQENTLGFNSITTNLMTFEDTTLDIGLQYQTKWNKTGLVIRIDLVNLLGAAPLEDSLSKSMDVDARGLVPYTFQSPKYIKLSGSINF